MSKTKTVEEWFALGDDLPLELGRVLTPGPWNHTWEEGFWNESETMRISLRCSKCKVFTKDTKRDTPSQYCSVPDPITIDGNTAMAWRDKTVGKGLLLYMKKMWEWSGYELEISFPQWLLSYAQPKHLLIAAAMAAEGEEE